MAPLQLYSACKPVQNCAHPPWALGNFFGTLVLRVSRTLPVAAAALHVHTAMLHHICTITVALHMFTRLCCTTSVQSLSSNSNYGKQRYVVTYLNLKILAIIVTLLWPILLSSLLM